MNLLRVHQAAGAPTQCEVHCSHPGHIDVSILHLIIVLGKTLLSTLGQFFACLAAKIKDLPGFRGALDSHETPPTALHPPLGLPEYARISPGLARVSTRCPRPAQASI